MAKILTFERRQRARSAMKQLGQTRPAIDAEYSAFNQLDGSHSLQAAVPEACVMYDVRILPEGKVAYFNWDLAKEMGLVESHHPHRMNRRLEEKLLETFCIRIINEWDKENNVLYPKTVLKKNQYMATRYLQLQHPDKAGRTSGDGRCIWNGQVSHKGRIWDVSSRGTGVTSLAPGVVLAGKPLRSGNTEHGYGCGMAEIDELYAAAIMAEIFHRRGIATERVLLIIDLGRGMGIGVRAGQNLLRPAHLFSHLRQGQRDRLKRATDYIIARQNRNGKWPFSAHHRRRYDLMLERLTEDFARLVAALDREYIFAWLDWDGDNVLIDAGLIDYGSVRQFGLRHDQYRYDDVERFSTNLNQQRDKARLIVQTFAQMVDYLNTGARRPITDYRRHPAVRRFDQRFEHHILDHFLHQVGLDPETRAALLQKSTRFVKDLYREFSGLERLKTYRRTQRVADGINRPAILNMRHALAELPALYLSHLDKFSTWQLPEADFFQLVLSENATGKDRQLSARLSKRLRRLQILYKGLVRRLAATRDLGTVLKSLSDRAAKINRLDRLTGNALIHVVDELLKARKKGLGDSAIQDVITAIIDDQSLATEVRLNQGPIVPTVAQDLFNHVLTLVHDHHEEI